MMTSGDAVRAAAYFPELRAILVRTIQRAFLFHNIIDLDPRMERAYMGARYLLSVKDEADLLREIDRILKCRNL